jgi:signal transduction histidine kinase
MALSAPFIIPAKIAARLFMPFGEFWFWLALLILPLIVISIYIAIVQRYGRRVIERLFAYGNEKEWAFYAFASIVFYTIITFSRQIVSTYPPLGFMILFLILLSIIILCFAIINTHEKTQQKHELAMSREILSSGRDYYDKLTAMTENLHIMRHDYKYHLASIQMMIRDGNLPEVQAYLDEINTEIESKSIHEYCKSCVLNALLDSYDERCRGEGISFSVKIIPPSQSTIDDYELCVIVGNLLENAFTACLRTPKSRPKYVELSMRPRDAHYGIKVENSYDGVLQHEGKELFSTKKNGGLGISSIKSVAKLHDGEYVPVWDSQKFSAFVVLKLPEED